MKKKCKNKKIFIPFIIVIFVVLMIVILSVSFNSNKNKQQDTHLDEEEKNIVNIAIKASIATTDAIKTTVILSEDK